MVWSKWTTWNDIETGIVRVTKESGVYEARLKHNHKLLTIGKSVNLRKRIERALVKGKMPHSAGRKIRANEDTSKILVRWAITDRPVAVEEELHIKYKDKFGKLPKYVKHI